MIFKVFCIFDSKVKDYIQPFFMHHEGEALRGFEQLAKDPSSKIHQYADDYTLFHLGEFDSHTGKFTNLNAPESLAQAVHFKK